MLRALMGLLDSILGAVLGGGSNATSDQHSLLAQLATGLITNHASGNGLTGLVQQFEQQGLGHIAQSWVGNGPNQAISPDQVHQVLGADQVQQLVQQTGMQGGDVASALAAMLPQIIDKLTPQGQVPQGAGLQSAITSLLGTLGK